MSLLLCNWIAHRTQSTFLWVCLVILSLENWFLQPSEHRYLEDEVVMGPLPLATGGSSLTRAEALGSGILPQVCPRPDFKAVVILWRAGLAGSGLCFLQRREDHVGWSSWLQLRELGFPSFFSSIGPCSSSGSSSGRSKFMALPGC